MIKIWETRCGANLTNNDVALKDRHVRAVESAENSRGINVGLCRDM